MIQELVTSSIPLNRNMHYRFHDNYEKIVRKDCQDLVMPGEISQYHWVETKLVDTHFLFNNTRI